MRGNVYEWCQHWYDESYYETSKKSRPRGIENPKGPKIGSGRVLRGGSWHAGAPRCRSANRSGSFPATRLSDVGFLLVFVP
ncbi:MAG: SUMF1/EgtB/PvdO family nonheme iron enzyme [candidate division KSB1 bacterium]|nr:SUMF1/EgtB/PvdO family nonheme iron enzyme [candidate division KSB1 bacterium]MDZ7365552.1 SUMF1/EgtB/PvdO family nonheme iron enzyme [candidate division KSB1 bacterium]MDZ7403655.1 SUMF1/EgtB/PvdO family nonheme iron enzyme [candidate division KSB1 bacterium]